MFEECPLNSRNYPEISILYKPTVYEQGLYGFEGFIDREAISDRWLTRTRTFVFNTEECFYSGVSISRFEGKKDEETGEFYQERIDFTTLTYSATGNSCSVSSTISGFNLGFMGVNLDRDYPSLAYPYLVNFHYLSVCESVEAGYPIFGDSFRTAYFDPPSSNTIATGYERFAGGLVAYIKDEYSDPFPQEKLTREYAISHMDEWVELDSTPIAPYALSSFRMFSHISLPYVQSIRLISGDYKIKALSFGSNFFAYWWAEREYEERMSFLYKGQVENIYPQYPLPNMRPPNLSLGFGALAMPEMSQSGGVTGMKIINSGNGRAPNHTGGPYGLADPYSYGQRSSGWMADFEDGYAVRVTGGTQGSYSFTMGMNGFPFYAEMDVYGNYVTGYITGFTYGLPDRRMPSYLEEGNGTLGTVWTHALYTTSDRPDKYRGIICSGTVPENFINYNSHQREWPIMSGVLLEYSGFYNGNPVGKKMENLLRLSGQLGVLHTTGDWISVPPPITESGVVIFEPRAGTLSYDYLSSLP